MLLLTLLAVTVFLTSAVSVMLGPILVPLAADLHTSVAIAGQLITVTSLVWGFSAFAIGPASDIYGRRKVLLIGLLLLSAALTSAALAVDYSTMLAARVLTGFAGAMILPTCYATCADHVSPNHRGRALAWIIAATGLGAASGLPLTAWLASLDSWRTPFWVLGMTLAATWACTFSIFPRYVIAPSHVLGFLAHFRRLGSHRQRFWQLVTVNILLQAACWGMFAYLPAYLMQAYALSTSEIVFPLALAGTGVLGGSLIAGPLSDSPGRASLVVAALLFGGILVAILFCAPFAQWGTGALACCAAGMFMLVPPLVLNQLIGFSQQSRGTATGIFALSNQLGCMAGPGVGGLLLSLGGFPGIGLGCLAAAVTAALVMARTTFDASDALAKHHS